MGAAARPLVALLVAMGFTVSCNAPLPASEDQWRKGREAAVQRALGEGASGGFDGLRFYPYDPSCRFRTLVAPIAPPEPIRFPTSSGEVRPAHRVGRVTLGFPGGQATLAVYQLDDVRRELPGYLFLPFRDAGAGDETYGAGRYVEVTALSGGVVEIDFNRAYNPDCAYGITAQCPITPDENTLPFAVRAGEMTPPALPPSAER